MTDPEDRVNVDHDQLVDREADVVSEFDRDLPIEANEADVIEQKLDVPEDDEDAYPG